MTVPAARGWPDSVSSRPRVHDCSEPFASYVTEPYTRNALDLDNGPGRPGRSPFGDRLIPSSNDQEEGKDDDGRSTESSEDERTLSGRDVLFHCSATEEEAGDRDRERHDEEQPECGLQSSELIQPEESNGDGDDDYQQDSHRPREFPGELTHADDEGPHDDPCRVQARRVRLLRPGRAQ